MIDADYELARTLNGLIQDDDIASVKKFANMHPIEPLEVHLPRDNWIHIAFRTASLEMIKLLLDLGQDLNAQVSGDAENGLVYAAQRGDVARARTLIEWG